MIRGYHTLTELENQVRSLVDRLALTKDTKYHRGARFDYKIQPDWKAMYKFRRANTARRTCLLINWCDKHCQGDYSYDGLPVGFSFKVKSDAMLFKLAWG